MRGDPFHVCCLVVLLLCGGAALLCPPKHAADISPCKCQLSTHNYLQVWCSGADLESLTRGLSSLATWRGAGPVDELVVEGGVVGGLPGRAFAPLRVRRLLMHRSGLERLSGAALLQLEESLVELMLIEPRLRSVPAELLDSLPVLEALTIDTESEDESDAFPGRPLSVPLLHSLPSLRYLRISAPQSSGLGGVFPLRDTFSLPALLSLSLHGGWAHSKNTREGDEALWPLFAFVAGCCGGVEEINIAGNGLRLGRRLASASPKGDVMLRSLRILDMSDNPLGMGWEDDGEQIPHIQWLLDSAPAWIFPSLMELRADRALISMLPEGALRSMPELERLSLEGNSMRSIGPDALTDLPSLHQLRLRDNLLSEESMPPAPYRRRLPFTLPTLKGLDLSRNILRGGSALRRLLSGTPSIRRLDLSENAIKNLADDVFTTTPLLEFVDLSGNPVLTPSLHSTPPHLSFLKPLSRLYELRISGNSMESGSLPVEPRHLGIDNSSFPVLPPLPGVEVLVASDMSIGRLYRHHSTFPPFSAALLPRLTLLDLSGNSLSLLEPGAFSGVSTTLSGMNLSRNKLSGVLRLGPPISMRSLQRLDVSHNLLEAISIAASAAIPELKLLNASWNVINSLEMGLPSVLGPSLEVLDLSRNGIVTLPEEPLRPFVMLTELWLDANQICSITGQPFDATPRLRLVSLRYNRLSTLSPNPFRLLLSNPTAYNMPTDNNMYAKTRTLLQLEGNPLLCTCSLLWLQEWLQEREDTEDEEELKCRDGTPLRLMRLTRKDCQKQLTTSALISSDAALLHELDNRSGVCLEDEDTKDHGSVQELLARPLAVSSAQKVPSPEESEYFYDQYVDEIHPPLGNLGALEDNHTDSVSTLATTTESITTSTTAISQEHVSGELPTIYARPKNQSSSDDKNDISGGGGISIFGIPIPSWSLSGLFGSGKRRAGGTAKVARVNNPTGRPFTGRGRGSEKILSDRPPANWPTLESGFKPIFPGSGGFVPINGQLGASTNAYKGQSTVPLKSHPTTETFLIPTTVGKIVTNVSFNGSSLNPDVEHSENKTSQPFITNKEKDLNVSKESDTVVASGMQIKYNRQGIVIDKYVVTTEPTAFVSSFASVSESGRQFQNKWGGNRAIGTVERVELKKGVEVSAFDSKNSVGKAIMVASDSGEENAKFSDGAKNVPEIITVKDELIEEIGITDNHSPQAAISSFPSPSPTPEMSSPLPTNLLNETRNSTESTTTSPVWSTTHIIEAINEDHRILPERNNSGNRHPVKGSSSGRQGTPLSSYLLAPGGQARITKFSAHEEATANAEFGELQRRTKSGFPKWPTDEQKKRSRLPEWYYANYNASEVYKGPIEDIIVTEGYPAFPSAATFSRSRDFNLTLLAFVIFSIFLNPYR